MFLPTRDRGVVRAIFSEVPGKRPPGAGTGGREAGPPTVSEREPGAQRTQPGSHTLQYTTQRILLCSLGHGVHKYSCYYSDLF